VERLTRIEDGFDYQITIEDPHVFAAPWTVSRTFRSNVPPMKKIMEFVCEITGHCSGRRALNRTANQDRCT